MWILSNLYNNFINIIFPKKCFLCKKEKEIICKKCLSGLSLSLDTPYYFIFSYFSYRDKNLKRIMHHAKYFHRKDLFLPLVSFTTEVFKNEIIDNPNDYILIPIPMPTFRKILRGYNQTEIIAQIYSRQLNIPHKTNILFRKKDTVRQIKSKTRSGRLQNQKGSFEIKNTEEIKNKKIILIDDITTTGSTLNEARNVFLKNGIKDVIAITLAH